MTISGVRNIVVSGSAGVGELFVSMNNYLTSTFAQALGVSCIAYNTGSGGGGGMDYPNATKFVGNNAWSCYLFASATIPFCMFMQVATSSTNTTPFGQAGSPGAPGAFNSFQSLANGGLGIQFAIRADGLSPWNGGSASNGSDCKGTPVWQPGTSSLAVFPRANNANGGTFSVNKEACMDVAPYAYVSANSWRQYMVIDQNNVFISYSGAAGTSYGLLYFGKYSVFSGSLLNPDIPYVCLQTQVGGNDPLLANGLGNPYGSLANNANLEGGVPHVTSSNGVFQVVIDYPTTFLNTTMQPNQGYSPPAYEEFPIPIAVYEWSTGSTGGLAQGWLGQIEFLRSQYNLATYTTNLTRTRTVWGGSTVASTKITSPWDGLTDPTPNGTPSRTGSFF